MINSYLKVLVRSFRKAKLFTLVNLSGLSIGMLAFLLIFHYVKFESSYDSFHEHIDRLYRITVKDIDEDGNELDEFATVSPAYGPYMKSYFSEVVDYSRLVSTRPFMSKPALSANDNMFFEDHLYYADSQFLKLFTFPLLEGNVNTALNQPNSIIISEALAIKYFGNKKVVGEVLTLEMGNRGAKALKVTGILKNLPENSHINAEALISFNTLPAGWHLDEVLDWGDFYVYVKLSSDEYASQVRKRLPVFLSSLIGKHSKKSSLVMQNVKEIHLNSKRHHEIKPTGDEQSLHLLFLIGVLILAIAWINYVNLTLAKTLDFVKEFGLRKMMGATSFQLTTQMLANTLALNLIAFCIALTFAQLLLPITYQFIDQPMVSGIFEDPMLLLTVFLVVLSGSIISGIYPSLVLKKTKLINIYKGVLGKRKRGLTIKKMLLGIQLVTTAMLIAMTLAIYQQLQLLKTQTIGVNIAQTIIVKGPAKKDNNYIDKWQNLAATLKGQINIDEVAVSTSIPGKELGWGRGMYRLGRSAEHNIPISIVAVDPNYFPLYNVRFIAGKNFEPSINPNSDNAILNKEAVLNLGYDEIIDAIGSKVTWNENGQQVVLNIIGVVDNFNQRSGKFNHQSIIFPLKSRLEAPWADEFYSIRLNTTEASNAIVDIQSAWRQVFSDNPFDYFFLDDYYHQQYKSDEKFGAIFNGFTTLAIFISMLGLFGLFNLTVSQRIKEVGIRKVLGASLMNLINLLFKEYLAITMIALLFSIPIAYYLADAWLQEFANRIELGYWFFISPVVSLFLIIATTLSFQLYSAATKNPVDALRYE